MKIFLDSADLDEIRLVSEYGIIDGITTNPSLLASSGSTFATMVRALSASVKGHVSIEVVANDFTTMKQQGDKLLSIAENIVVKLPITWDGIKACEYFASKGAKVNMTLCFSLSQALLAAKAGAYYVSPFIGRLEDNGKDGAALVKDIRAAYDNGNLKTQILAASIRSSMHVEKAALSGADVVTLPRKIIAEMIQHDLTDAGLKKFNDDWQNSGKVFDL